MVAGYDVLLVFLSYCISVLGSYTALKMASGMIAARAGSAFWLWLGGAAFALGGGGIWAMHFVGMLAYETPVDFGYDLGITMLSLVLAIAVVGAGLFIVGRFNGQLAALLVGGTVTGLGVTVMHYTGMEAMVMPGDMVYDPALVTASVLIAVAAAICALWLALHVEDFFQRLASALVMGIAVCGMHYTGMAAMHISYEHDFSAAGLDSLQYQAALEPAVLAIVIAVVVVGILLALLVGSMVGNDDDDRYAPARIRD